MNKWIGIGRLTRDTEIKASGNGTEFCKFTIAVDRAYTKQGEERKCDFVDCTTFGKQAAFVNKYFHKGDGIVVEGRLESDKWTDKDGNKRTSWGIMVDRVEFPPSRKGQSDAAPAQSAAFADEDDDGEIPF